MMQFQNVSQLKFNYLAHQLVTAGNGVVPQADGTYLVTGKGLKVKVSFTPASGLLVVQPDNLVARMAAGKIQSTLNEYLSQPIPSDFIGS